MYRCLLVIAVCSISFPVFAKPYEDFVLWLPVKYEYLYLKLKEATTAAANLERCSKVLEATVDLEKTQIDKPIFRVLCRQPNGRTYNEIVDGNTSRTLTTYVPIVEELSEEALLAQEQERIRLAEEAKRQRKIDMFNLCKLEFERVSEFMLSVEPLFDSSQEPTSQTATQLVYHLNFNAQNPQKEPLRYHGLCVVNEQKVESFKVRSRRDKVEKSR